MKFRGVLRGVEYADAKEFAAAVKAAPPLEPLSRGEKPVKVKMAPHPDHVGIKGFPMFKKPQVTLTAPEREWLGASVRRSDGRVGQVWSLAPTNPGAPLSLWLVADGEAFLADVASVTRVES